MNRVDLIELGSLRVQSPYSSATTSKKQETRIQREGFSLVETPLKARIDLERPEAIYSNDFASTISMQLIQGKTVEINCGIDNKKTAFICQELTLGEALEKIKRQDGQEVKSQSYTKRKRKSFWDIFGTKQLIVSLTRTNKSKPIILPKREIVQEEFALVPFSQAQEEYNNQNPDLDIEDIDHFFVSYGKYTNTPVIEAEYPFKDYYEQMESLLKEHGIVEIKRKDLQGNPEFLGLFVEKEQNSKETIINLNGQDEEHFEEIFTPLVRYFINKGERVLVDHDALDPYELENKIYESPVYSSLCEQTTAELRIEEREINPFTKEQRIYVVIQP